MPLGFLIGRIQRNGETQESWIPNHVLRGMYSNGYRTSCPFWPVFDPLFCPQLLASHLSSLPPPPQHLPVFPTLPLASCPKLFQHSPKAHCPAPQPLYSSQAASSFLGTTVVVVRLVQIQSVLSETS